MILYQKKASKKASQILQHVEITVKMMQQDMEVNKILDLVKVGRQIISMTLLETVWNGPKKRTAPATELAEEAAITAVALAVRLLAVTAAVLPAPTAAMVLALLYI